MGVIALEGMHFYAHHGFYREEQVIGGQYVVDVYLTANLDAAIRTDDLKTTVNYELVYRLVQDEMKEKASLIEHVAGRIIKAIAKNFTGLNKIRIRVSKINPPVKGTVDRVFVEIEENLIAEPKSD